VAMEKWSISGIIPIAVEGNFGITSLF